MAFLMIKQVGQIRVKETADQVISSEWENEFIELIKIVDLFPNKKIKEYM